MDTKRLLTSMLIAGAVMLLFNYFSSGKAAAPTIKTPYSIYSTLPAKSLAAEGDAKPELVTLGDPSAGSKDKVAVTISNQTAGIEKVQLNVNDYAQTVKGKDPLTLFTAVPGLAKPFSTLGIHITLGASAKELPFGVGLFPDSSAEQIAKANATSILDTQYVWKFLPHAPSAMEVSLSMSFNYDNKPLAEIIKTFHVDPTSYEITITHTVKNLTDLPLKVQIDQLGAGDLPRDDPQSDDRFWHATGLNTGTKKVESNRFNVTQIDLEKFTGATRDAGQFYDYSKDPNLWIASSNRFFVSIIRPLPITGAAPKMVALADGNNIPEANHIANASIDVMAYAAKPTEDQAIIRFTGAVVEVAPGGTVAEPISVYLGPKKRDILLGGVRPAAGTPEYYYAAYEYISIIQFSQRTCILYAYCVSDTVALAILWMLDFLKHTIAFNNYGIAIMILVIIVRACLHPLTRASQINMAKMGKQMRDVAPLIEAMKKKYPATEKPGNKKKQQEETMRIYRENNVNPAGGILGCLPMLIQLPIWAALLSGLRMDIDLRHASFIPGWINDLSNPDTVWPTAAMVLGRPLFTLPFFGFEVYGLNPLPILLAVVFFINMRVSMASQPKPTDENQIQMQKWSQYSIFLFPLFLYNAPSGSNLYMFASTMGGLLDTYLVRKALKKKGILPQSAHALPSQEDQDAKD